MAKSIFSFILIFNTSFLFAQTFSQYFEGADTSIYNSIIIELDSSSSNIWQIGRPQKTIFDSAATLPNVIITDSINSYPVNNTSSFTFYVTSEWFSMGILALQWKQKLDLEKKQDGGIIEYSMDKGSTWENVFNNPYVYNFYGYNVDNQDTLQNGNYAFSGTDTIWRDIWLCFENSFLSTSDTVLFRFSLESDSIDNFKEGWMIDNLLVHITTIHGSINDQKQENYLNIYPNPTNDVLYIEAEKIDGFHIIECMELINMEGKVIERYEKSPTKFYINIGHLNSGLYYLKINTNIKIEILPVFLNKEQSK